MMQRPISQQQNPHPYGQPPSMQNHPQPYQQQQQPPTSQHQWASLRQPNGKIWNPCCCCRGCCNLRCNCVAIAACFLVAWICVFAVGLEKVPPPKDCSADPQREKECASFNIRVTGLVAAVAITGTLWFAAAILILLAVFLRNGMMAAAAGFVAFLALLVFLILIGVAAGSIYSYLGWFRLDVLLDMDEDLTMEELIGIGVVALFGLLIAVVLQLWAVLCCFQFRNQIKAGVDLDPAIKGTVYPQFQQPHTENVGPPPAYSNQAHAAPSAGVNANASAADETGFAA